MTRSPHFSRLAKRWREALHWLLLATGFVAFVLVHEHRAPLATLDEVREFAGMVEQDVWELDANAAEQLVHVMIDSRPFAKARLMHDDATTFVSRQREVTSQEAWFGRERSLSVPLHHGEEPIGQLEVGWVDLSLLTYLELATLALAVGVLITALQRSWLAHRARARARLRQEVAKRTRAESILSQREAELESARRLEAIGTLAGGVAHDFNNLLSVTLGHAELLRHSLDRDHRGQESLDCIVQSSQRAAHLTRQLLAFGRRQALEPQVFDLVGMVQDTEMLLRRLVPEGVELRMNVDRTPAWVNADRSQIERVLFNLVCNARDAMPSGGVLNISVDVEQQPREPRVCLEVSDTGTGMSPEVRERIFEPFFTTKPEGQGTGLGLSTVHGIVHQSGGTIEVTSEPGAGTAFRVILPHGRALR